MMMQQARDGQNSARGLFERVFWPLYPPEVRADLEATRESFVNPANDCGLTELIDEIAEAFKFLAPSLLNLPSKSLDDTDASVHRLGAALTRRNRDSLLHERTVGTNRTPLLAMIAIHGTLYVERCIVANHGAQWLVRKPLWESSVRLRSPLGEAELSVFQWWLKSLSDEEVDRCPLGDRYRTYVEVPCFNGDALPVIGDPSASIPRLNRPTIDSLRAHLRLHAPRIRSLGVDFPAQPAFDAMGFAWLDMEWVGDGRMLVIHGPSPARGLHVFWLNVDGFLKAAFYPTDDGAYELKCNGAKMRVSVGAQDKRTVHEMPWWGP